MGPTKQLDPECNVDISETRQKKRPFHKTPWHESASPSYSLVNNMALGEIFGEVIIRVFGEFLFYTVFYFTGYALIWVITLGQVSIAPLSSMDEWNRGKNRWTDWSIWLTRSGSGKKLLKAQFVCFAGMIFWILAAVAAYFIATAGERAVTGPTS